MNVNNTIQRSHKVFKIFFNLANLGYVSTNYVRNFILKENEVQLVGSLEEYIQ